MFETEKTTTPADQRLTFESFSPKEVARNSRHFQLQIDAAFTVHGWGKLYGFEQDLENPHNYELIPPEILAKILGLPKNLESLTIIDVGAGKALPLERVVTARGGSYVAIDQYLEPKNVTDQNSTRLIILDATDPDFAEQYFAQGQPAELVVAARLLLNLTPAESRRVISNMFKICADQGQIRLFPVAVFKSLDELTLPERVQLHRINVDMFTVVITKDANYPEQLQKVLAFLCDQPDAICLQVVDKKRFEDNRWNGYWLTH